MPKLTKEQKDQISRNVRASMALSGKKISDKDWEKIQKAAERLRNII